MADPVQVIPQAGVMHDDAQLVVQPIVDHGRVVAPPALNPLADISSPYYLHLGESPGLVLVSLPVTETNYYAWSKVMRVALHSKDKLGFIDGVIPEPPIGDPFRRA